MHMHITTYTYTYTKNARELILEEDRHSHMRYLAIRTMADANSVFLPALLSSHVCIGDHMTIQGPSISR